MWDGSLTPRVRKAPELTRPQETAALTAARKRPRRGGPGAQGQGLAAAASGLACKGSRPAAKGQGRPLHVHRAQTLLCQAWRRGCAWGEGAGGVVCGLMAWAWVRAALVACSLRLAGQGRAGLTS